MSDLPPEGKPKPSLSINPLDDKTSSELAKSVRSDPTASFLLWNRWVLIGLGIFVVLGIMSAKAFVIFGCVVSAFVALGYLMHLFKKGPPTQQG